MFMCFLFFRHCVFVFFKQKTAYEMRISDWSSDVCSSDLEMMLKNDQLEAWDRDCFFHPSTHLAQFARGEGSARIVTGGEGVYIRDRDGTRLLDAFAGLYCLNVGNGRKEIGRAHV